MRAQPPVSSVPPTHVPPMAKYKGINANLKNLPKARSSNRWYKDKEKRKVCFVLCGSLLCILIIAAIFALPIALTILLTTTTTIASTSTTVSTTVITTGSSINASNTTVGSNTTAGSNITTTTTTNTTTTICPNMTCTFSSIASPMTPTYGVEHLDINCTESVSDMMIELIVQRTVNASYANQYQTFWNLTTNQTYIETNSQIIYTWTLLNGQLITGIGFPYFVEGQFTLTNTNQTTSLDTYSASFTSVCGLTVSKNGTF